jgi:hypothetical protein
LSLARLQEAMKQWLETGDPDYTAYLGDAARPGLDVYLNNYRTQLLHCLDQAFPRTHAWLGSERFHAAARCHIMAQPPSAWTLDAYPASFAAEVGSLFPDDLVTHEIVRLELALADAQTAADRPPLTRAMFVDLHWDHVALAHASGGQVLRQFSNAAEIWSALSRAESPPAAQTAEGPAGILVWRSKWVPCFRTLDPDEAELFAQMTTPLPFTDICTQLERMLGEQAALERAGRLLARWADDEAVSIAL